MTRLVLLILALALPACSSPTLSPLTVTITDAANNAPIAGAKVVAEVPSMDHPFSVKTLFGETGPISHAAFTDERGVAIVRFAEGRPVRIGILAPTYPVVIQLIEEPWLRAVELTGDATPEGERRMSVRVEPPGAAPPEPQ